MIIKQKGDTAHKKEKKMGVFLLYKRKSKRVEITFTKLNIKKEQ